MHVRFDMITCYAVRAGDGGHEFLQLRRVPNDFMGGTWQAVSGGIEAGETAWAAALRELREEAGLVPMEFYRLPVMNLFYIHQHDTIWHATPFCAVVDRHAPIAFNPEHDAHRWVQRAELDRCFMWESDRQAIQQACREILDGGPAKPYLRIPLP
jgi:dATP pyrophosphohydrolase